MTAGGMTEECEAAAENAANTSEGVTDDDDALSKGRENTKEDLASASEVDDDVPNGDSRNLIASDAATVELPL